MNKGDGDDTPSPKMLILITRRDTQISFYRRCPQLFAIIKAKLLISHNQLDVRFPNATTAELANSLTAKGQETPPVIVVMSKSLRQVYDEDQEGFLIPFATLLGLPMRRCLVIFDTGEWWDSHRYLQLSRQIENEKLDKAYKTAAAY